MSCPISIIKYHQEDLTVWEVFRRSSYFDAWYATVGSLLFKKKASLPSWPVASMILEDKFEGKYEEQLEKTSVG